MFEVKQSFTLQIYCFFLYKQKKEKEIMIEDKRLGNKGVKSYWRVE